MGFKRTFATLAKVAHNEHWQELRQVVTRVLTPAGWLTGTLHIPMEVRLVDFLSDPGQKFFKLTHVLLPTEEHSLDFLAIQRSAVILVVPADSDELVAEVVGAQPGMTQRDVACLFQGGKLKGKFSVRKENRVSDELMGADSFFPVSRCSIDLEAEEKGLPSKALLVCVQAAAILGVAEMTS